MKEKNIDISIPKIQTNEEYERRKNEFINNVFGNNEKSEDIAAGNTDVFIDIPFNIPTRVSLNAGVRLVEEYYTLDKEDFIEVSLNENNTDCIEKVKLYRIKAINDIVINDEFPKIKKGDLGGYIQNTSNISKCNISWVDKDSIVYGNTVISSSIIQNSVIVDSLIEDCVIKDSKITESGPIKDYKIKGSVITNSKFYLEYNFFIDAMEGREICDSNISNSKIKYGNVYFSDILGSIISANVINSKIRISKVKYHDIQNASLLDAKIKYDNDYISLSNIGFNNENLTAYIGKDNMIYVLHGIFFGTLHDFKIYIKSMYTKGGNIYNEYMAIIDLIKVKLIKRRVKE